MFEILLLSIGIINIVFLILVIVKLSKKNDQRELEKSISEIKNIMVLQRENMVSLRDSIYGVNEKVSLQKGEIIEKVNEKNTDLSKEMTKELEELRSGNRDSLDKINNTLNEKITIFQKDVFEKFSALQVSNEERLEKMRAVVEEKLDKTLSERLKLSFESVSNHLQDVQKGLGEMQTLAADVGGLKKAISNVKTRGVFGEIQLERILEELLTPTQYEKNAQVKASSQERVEFAIKLPGKSDYDSTVYLAIDSKFPSEDYEALLIAYEEGDKVAIDVARTVFANKIKTFAKEISGKYINPPLTTDFALLFLPFESLYAEVVQSAGLFEELQRNYKITVAGPTTLSAFLNALQLGFRTLAIEKRSSEVWNILGAVKTEFGKFESSLVAVQKKLQGAEKELENVIGTRTNAMNRKLRDVEELTGEESQEVLAIGETLELES